MPKLIVLLNMILLLCFSVLAGGSVPALLGSGPALPHCLVQLFTGVGLVTGVIMFLTEIFSGVKWVPVVALGALAAGWFLAAPIGSAVAWIIGWWAVAIWFGYLAFQAREDR